MKVVVQRCTSASCTVNNELINKIDSGLMILVGINVSDTKEDLDYIVKKIVNLRIFDDDDGIMNKSIIDVGGSILLISQFTLQAITKNGNRPSYVDAMKGTDANIIYEEMINKLNEVVPTYKGAFGCDMKISLVNDGPVTIVIDSKNK